MVILITGVCRRQECRSLGPKRAVGRTQDVDAPLWIVKVMAGSGFSNLITMGRSGACCHRPPFSHGLNGDAATANIATAAVPIPPRAHCRHLTHMHDIRIPQQVLRALPLLHLLDVWQPILPPKLFGGMKVEAVLVAVGLAVVLVVPDVLARVVVPRKNYDNVLVGRGRALALWIHVLALWDLVLALRDHVLALWDHVLALWNPRGASARL